ncbi:MAG UNVERIFIED_CONTAM: rRNA maturation RNase YbeY [Planctomycetaceae bacterium]
MKSISETTSRCSQSTAQAIRRAVVTALREEHVQAAVVSITLVDNETIHRVNREHLQHDYPTDVISFQLDYNTDDNADDEEEENHYDEHETETAAESQAQDEGNEVPRCIMIEGEIIASAEMAIQMASECGWSPSSELLLYIIHGLLHICGYDDLSPPEKTVMRSRERHILGLLGLQPAYPQD